MMALLDNPEQWERYKAERPETAADEIVRWATPVVAFQRTAKVDTELGGQAIAAGQRVGIFYSSANFDETVFDNPNSSTSPATPIRTLASAGSGAHYCLAPTWPAWRST